MSMGMTFSQARKVARDEGEADRGPRRGGGARAAHRAPGPRHLAVPDAARERILAQKDRGAPGALASRRAIVAASVAEVIDEPT